MKKGLLILVCLFNSVVLSAQQGVLFTNSQNGTEVLVKEGDLIKISYNGYIGQHEGCYGVVSLIRDSILEISIVGATATRRQEIRSVYIKDITGFRKFHKSKPGLQLLARIAAAVGSIYLYYAVDRYTELTFAEKFGLSIGTGVASGLIVKSFFPERIKNRIAPGMWTVTILR